MVAGWMSGHHHHDSARDHHQSEPEPRIRNDGKRQPAQPAHDEWREPCRCHGRTKDDDVDRAEPHHLMARAFGGLATPDGRFSGADTKKHS